MTIFPKAGGLCPNKRHQGFSNSSSICESVPVPVPASTVRLLVQATVCAGRSRRRDYVRVGDSARTNHAGGGAVHRGGKETESGHDGVLG